MRTDGGRLFHTSGPQTEKARLPNWVELLTLSCVVCRESSFASTSTLLGTSQAPTLKAVSFDGLYTSSISCGTSDVGLLQRFRKCPFWQLYFYVINILGLFFFSFAAENER